MRPCGYSARSRSRVAVLLFLLTTLTSTLRRLAPLLLVQPAGALALDGVWPGVAGCDYLGVVARNVTVSRFVAVLPNVVQSRTTAHLRTVAPLAWARTWSASAWADSPQSR